MLFDDKSKSVSYYTYGVRIVGRSQKHFGFIRFSEVFSELVVGDVPHHLLVDFFVGVGRRLDGRLVGLAHVVDRLRHLLRRSFVSQGLGELFPLILTFSFILKQKHRFSDSCKH